MKARSVLFALLRTAVCGERVNETIVNSCTPEILEEVYALAAKHDLAHLVCHALDQLSLPTCPATQKFQRAKSQAIFRFVKLDHTYSQILGCLEEAQIPFIPLKGSVLRRQYPEPWMRTSCDIDILVHEKDLDRAEAALTSALSFQSNGKGDHDIAMSSPAGVSLELHYDTVQQRYANDLRREVLATFWERAVPVTENAFEHRIPEDLFYFYHIAHIAKHFETGGCGVRSILDIWILHHRCEFDPQSREALLSQGGLLKFARVMEDLSESWFSGKPLDAVTEQAGNYILYGGMYGNQTNRAAFGQAKAGGKLRYLITRRIFMPYDYLKAEYPVLQKHKWLTPLFQVVRWVRTLFSGHLGRHIKEIAANVTTKDNARQDTQKMLKDLGLE